MPCRRQALPAARLAIGSKKRARSLLLGAIDVVAAFALFVKLGAVRRTSIASIRSAVGVRILPIGAAGTQITRVADTIAVAVRIRAAVDEMLARLEGKPENAAMAELRTRAERVYAAHDVSGMGQLADAFLQRHDDLIV